MLDAIREGRGGAILNVQVVPRSSKNELWGMYGDALRIRLKAPPAQGAANAALIEFLAKTLGVPQSRVEILSGHTSRRKRVLVSGLGREQVAQLLGNCLPLSPTHAR